ncbi:MAG: hypothetical protein LBR06_02740 [Bacteroidales bacterium]|jgi:hypothetical protein|nr:hypothetical protein [Bacteroidales bacterium]
MFGINSCGIWLGYLLAVLSVLLCVWYGAKKWNKDDDSAADDNWDSAETQLNENL